MDYKLINRIVLTASVAAASAGLMNTAANAAIYMKIPDIKGDVVVKGHEGEVALDSFQWGLSSTSASKRGVSTCVSGVTLTKDLDSATPKLISSSIIGTIYPSVSIIWAEPDSYGALVTYLKLTINDAQFVSYSTSSGAEGRPNESISLQFSSMDGEYTPSGKSGVVWTVLDSSSTSCP